MDIELFKRFIKNWLNESSFGGMTKLLDCQIIVTEFEL